jgi:AraC-like DNA-binding protein
VMGACVVTHDLACELADTFIQASYAPRERVLGIPPRRLTRVVQHVRNNLDKPLAVSALSRVAEMSQSHFSKLFKLSTGLAPHQFVLQERINRSKELLRQGNAKIVDVALQVGFENQAHFTTVFGNLVGMTPRQFQRSSDCESSEIYGPRLSVEQLLGAHHLAEQSL